MTPVIDETTSEIVIGNRLEKNDQLESSEDDIPDAIKHYNSTSSLYTAGGHQAVNPNDPPSFSRDFKLSADIPDSVGGSSAKVKEVAPEEVRKADRE
jgi:hypothetical protein